MAKPSEKLRALRMRRDGISIKSIASALNVSTGSVSLWCQSIELTSLQKEKLRKSQIAAGHRGRMIGAEINHQKRLNAIYDAEQWGKSSVGSLSNRDKYLLGIGLYWGEGAKSRTDTATITNSDPSIIVFSMRWMQDCFSLTKKDFNPYIYISESHMHRRQDIVHFWSKALKLPQSQFHIVFLKGRTKKVYENHNSYYGVCALRVRKGTNLKYRILGLIKACKENVGVAQMVGAQHS